LPCGREKVGNPFMDGIPRPAGIAAEFSLEDLLLILLVDDKRQISLAHRAAEDIHE
jgi:hypothetical protein